MKKKKQNMNDIINNTFNGILLKITYMSVKGKEEELEEFLEDIYNDISNLKIDLTGYDGFKEYANGFKESNK